MTFCLGMRVEDGLVGLADTRIVSGTETFAAHKVTTYERRGQAFFVMTAGLRSVRDKTMTYFEDDIRENVSDYTRLFKVVNGLTDCIRRVANEDGAALRSAGLDFNIHCLVGGQMRGDSEHKLYLVYPQANWVEVTNDTPYSIIGATGYGKPVLDRTLNYTDPIAFALKVGCLAFDSTRISAANVDFPLDVVLYARNSFQLVERRFHKDDLTEMTQWWQDRLRTSVQELPARELEEFLEGLPENAKRPPFKGPAAVPKEAG